MRPPARSLEFTQVKEWNSGEVRPIEDALAAEEPLEIRVNGEPVSVTMRTPGNDLELAAGFLLTEGMIDSREQVAQLQQTAGSLAARNVVEVQVQRSGFNVNELKRNFFAGSSCGICGKASIDAVRHRSLRAPDQEIRVTPEVLCALPEMLRTQQQVFDRTGGLHAAALFDADGKLTAVREDIGRHNAVDKLVGWALLEGQLPLSRSILMVSGRGGFEIVQKALAAGIPVVASVSAPSSLAVKLARELGLTLIGFLRGSRFVVYSGEFRCLPGPA